MEFVLKLYDRNGAELKVGDGNTKGDIVRISNGKRFTFFAEVKYLEKEQIIAPFHTFSFHSFEKVDKLPDGITKSKTEGEYDVWFLYDEDSAEDNDAEQFEKYLMSWRECEYHLEKRTYRISPKA